MTATSAKPKTHAEVMVELWDREGADSIDERLALLEDEYGYIDEPHRSSVIAYMEAMRKPLGSDENGVVPPGMPPGAGLVCEWDEVARFALGAILGFGNPA